MTNNSQNLIAGGLSGLTVSCVISCVCLLKKPVFQLQVEDIKPSGKSYYTGLLQAFVRIYKEEGIYGLWKGHVPAQCLSITFCGAQFVSFYAIGNILASQKSLDTSKWVRDLVSGSLTGIIASTLCEPLDVMRTRLIAQGKNQIYSSFLRGIRDLVHEEGLLGLWRGLGPCLISVVPQTTVYFATYEQLKRSYILLKSKESISAMNTSISLKSDVCNESSLQTGGNNHYSINWHFPLWAGGFSGLLAKTIVYPLDLAKKRLEIRGFEKSRINFGELPKGYTPSTYKNIHLTQLHRSQYFASFFCLTDIVKQQGVRGLYKGWIPSALKATLTTGLTFWFYEQYCYLLSYY
ncbi:Mitochondrial thiamine pyrophosphate carrier isoform 3 [Schistosoma japonicum]|uniref:Mitochondrial thiamine pyrophosphate carrier isoform 3 n=1 Tax=Schistosoma japonicum TaxID=6182 RepID=A0A4Z2CQT7_SCHJA|nr:Mitochondrial thiamine pyrophosphate carrier isoform 3 [Schistosoma japonicum]